MQTERTETESELDYHKRLIYGKLVDKTLADADYSELAKLAYGQEYSSDVARRMFYGSKKTLELMDKARIEKRKETNISDEIDAKLIELRKERQKFYDQRREFQKIVAKDGRFDHLRDIIADAAHRLGDEIGTMYQQDIPEYIDSKNEAVIIFSDWHYGMTASNVFNTYNTDICKERVRRTVIKMKDRIILHQCRALHIVVLGDLFHGAIHTSARVASEELVCEQLMHVSEILAQAIYELSRYTCYTKVYMTFGNHSRTVQSKNDSIHSDNMEKIINWWLIERFKNNDTIEIMPVPENEFLLFTVCDHTFVASHGDLDTVRTSPRMLSVLFQKTFGCNVEYILLGDKHHRESFDEIGVTAMLCGSLCGTDDYANDKRLYSTPSQLLLIVNSGCGVDAEYRITSDMELA